MPLAGRRWPVPAGRWPVAGGRWPDRPPVAGGRCPVAGGRWPVPGGRRPEAGGRRPEAGGRWPVAGGRWPVAGYQKKSIVGNRGRHKGLGGFKLLRSKGICSKTTMIGPLGKVLTMILFGSVLDRRSKQLETKHAGDRWNKNPFKQTTNQRTKQNPIPWPVFPPKSRFPKGPRTKTEPESGMTSDVYVVGRDCAVSGQDPHLGFSRFGGDESASQGVLEGFKGVYMVFLEVLCGVKKKNIYIYIGLSHDMLSQGVGMCFQCFGGPVCTSSAGGCLDD